MTQSKPTLINDEAVSPVVGVMLMIVVTIIIAAVVTGFAGGLVSSQKTAPTLSMDVKIANTGTYLGSGFYASVTGVSTPIATSDLKIVTTWTTTNRITGAAISGGNTSLPGVQNVNYHMNGKPTGVPKTGVAPFGTGPGVGVNGSFSVGSTDSNPTNPFTYYAQHFGNYTVMQGIGLFAYPAGAYSMASVGSVGVTSNADGGYGINGTTYYQYTSSPTTSWQNGDIDMMQAVLGVGWQNLKPGDTVNVKVIHVPSGKVIYQKAITVTEG